MAGYRCVRSGSRLHDFVIGDNHANVGVTMATPFKQIGIISKYGDPGITRSLLDLIHFLQQSGVEPLLDTATAEHLPATELPALERLELANRADLVVVLGGDGTMLNAARSLADAGVPLVGINLGRLGFLADLSPERLTRDLAAILQGDYEAEQRSLLHASVIRNGQSVSEADALNDVVVHKWDIARMIELDVSIDGQELSTQRSDGLIVSTPTGSTAYALSGGGPILHPSLQAVEMVPICPHSLNNRPIVISDQSRIDIRLCQGDSTQAQITCDGQVNFGLMPGDVIRITTKPRHLTLIHPRGYDYFAILRTKFNWGAHS